MTDVHDPDDLRPEDRRNVLGGPLGLCSLSPRTGFYRDGCCATGPDDAGRHVVCAEVTQAFLAFSRGRGNDLVTPRPDYGFPGLRPGVRWCLCAARWKEALDAGVAPPVVLASTHEAALRYVTLDELTAHALDLA
ncbi:MAG: DUF2237 domain-containing protein [Acidobacteriota bacterium]